MKFKIKAENTELQIASQKEYIDNQIKKLEKCINNMLNDNTISDNQKLNSLNKVIYNLTDVITPINYFGKED